MKRGGQLSMCCRLCPRATALATSTSLRFASSSSSFSSNSASTAATPQRTAAPPPIIDASCNLYANHRPTSLFQKGLLAAGSALAAIINPERADMVATLGETTGPSALRALHARMAAHPVGLEILQTKPRITEDTLAFDRLLAMPEDTLGGAYARWMRGHEFTPDERPAVRFVDDAELAYVMQRYREVHDFWHVLTGVPTTVLGEIALKCEYIPWAKRSATNATFLMNFYYERRLGDNLAAIRDELRLEPWHGQ
ncbi:coenzyme Q4like protein isoform 1, putative [Acanthamoeba castellanii str. Neff]|uniref:Ubiquinone biosynthesis protein COQ4 homolog, mitochondrial n=1 Tax=Acanthamoeba castellanii (strain ATCC 30010 / Neff) TaxID=1257118 RepID=L8GZD5_ACACF|nr:coenzyme Q4like protein isoform 1, putative [Acanthamoeba castellanii str. Neff]ELR18327.1 coenzyme Q4like protein isoform 1, putative [Acanthamoeba castellanii str. Neff]